MDLTSFIAAGARADSGFVVGLVLGGFTGFLVGPLIRSWLAYREWAEASREARLADRLLEKMESEAHGDDGPLTVEERVGATWRTHP